MNETLDTKSFRIDYRHLAFFFLGAVCVCAVFFALGFVVGRAQAFETALKIRKTSRTQPMAPSVPLLRQAALSRWSGKEEPPVVTEPAGKAEGGKHRVASC